MKGNSQKVDFKNEKEALSYKLALIGKKYFGTLTFNATDKTIDRYQSIFLVIVKSGGVSQQTLAKMIDVDKSTIVRMVDYLQEHDLVKRTANPDDRREHIDGAYRKSTTCSPLHGGRLHQSKRLGI
jgi:predicted HTH transcriptional regulator